MPTTITPTTIALAAEAFTRCPGLTPTARRVGHELLNYTDRSTGLAWPSESRLADALGVTVRTIQKAKVQLRQRGLLTWHQRGRHPHRTPVYELAWAALIALARGIKTRVKKVTARYRSPPPRPTGSPPRSIPSTSTPNLGANFRSPYLPQKKDRSSWDGTKKPAPRTPVQRRSGPDRYPPALLQQRAHTRLWTALTAQLSEQHLGNLINTLSKHPNIEKQVLAAEQRSWYSCLPLILKLSSEKRAI